MAKNVPLRNVAHARAFIEKFGFGEKHVPVDQFDMFIIDRGLATDPGTSNVKENAYKGFIQQRSAARRLLNVAGAWINGSSFQISVNGRNDGYSVLKWASDAQDFTKNVTSQVSTYIETRIMNLKALRNKAEGLIEAYGEDEDVHNAIVLLSSMSGHGLVMQAKIAGLLKQYDTAYTLVTSEMEKAIQRRLEDQPGE
jgi:hypothetical protein